MKKLVLILCFLITLLPIYSQKSNPNANINVKQIGSDYVKINSPKKLDNTVLILSTYSDSTKQISIKTKNVLSNNEVNFNNLQNINKNQWVICTGINLPSADFVLKGLTPETDYYLNIYTQSGNLYALSKIIAFNTVAQIPTKQASQISIIDATDNAMTIKWVNGTGKGRIVVVRKGADVDMPKNGEVYNFSNMYGDIKTKLGESYVVYDGNDKNINLTITNLEAGRYFLYVFEYNGDGKYRSYNTEKASNNPRSKATLLPTPKILSINSLSENSCEIKWEKVNGARTYILDVATDAGFRNKVEPYNDLDIGDLSSYEIVDMAQNVKYYIRIKAVGEGTQSNYSKGYEYQMNK